MSNNFYKRFPTVDFRIKNISSQQKSISVFGLTIPYNRSANLMAIPEITEAEIKASLTKGELSNKIRANDIKIVSSTINLLEFNTDFRDFIDNANVTPGTPVSGTDPYTQVGSGGSGTVIADGSTLSGTYDGDVLCLGDATLDGNVTINGTLTALGTLYNQDRHELFVAGDLHANVIDFNSNNSALSQSNFTVGGNLLFSSMYFVQSGSSSALLKVGGNLLGNTGGSNALNAYGGDNSPGLDVLVYGNMHISYIFLYGGDSDGSPAGNGGSITVYGNLHVERELLLYGGYGDNYDAGNGGDVEVYGNFTMGDDSYDVNFNGGDSYNANAGNGGTLYVSGYCVLTNNDGDTSFNGGSCDSDSELHRSGSGGDINIQGDLVCNTDIELNGGSRSGTLSSAGSVTPPHGGTLTVQGDARVDEIDVDGGSIFTNNFAPCNGANGGNISIGGNLTVDEEIYAKGGYSQYSDGGNGASIFVRGNLIVDDQIEVNGGDSGSGNGGNAGTIDVYGSMIADDYIDIYGGDGTNGNGGNAGSLYINGDLISNDSIYADGGNCDSTNESHYAGSGGSIYAKNISADNSYIYIDAGERFGATTVSNAGNNLAYAGEINCDGDCKVEQIYGSGSITNTSYPNSAATNGSTIYIGGNLNAYTIEIPGGDAYGNNAGRGGSIYVDGRLVAEYIYCNGGDSYNSVGVGADAGISGAGPNTVDARDGINAKYCYFGDGAGDGSAPTDSVSLLLSGNNTINELEMTDRASVYIKPQSLQQCTLKLGILDGKNTLNDTANNASTDISADVADHLYISDGVTWFGIAGSTIFA